MELDHAERKEWEEEQREKETARMSPPKRHREHPRIKVLLDYRHRCPGGHWYSKECKPIRKLTQRTFRRKMQRELWNEAYYHIRPRDYKTYGWLTW